MDGNGTSAGIGEDVTWEDFTALVCSRLHLRGLKGLYHASTGAPLRSMAELLDVEDLEVEVRSPERSSGARTLHNHSEVLSVGDAKLSAVHRRVQAVTAASAPHCRCAHELWSVGCCIVAICSLLASVEREAAFRHQRPLSVSLPATALQEADADAPLRADISSADSVVSPAGVRPMGCAATALSQQSL